MDSNTVRSLFISTEGSQTEWLSVLWVGNWTPNTHHWKNTGRFDLLLHAMHTIPYKKANFHPKLHNLQHWNPFPSTKIHFYFITAKNKTHYHWRIWSYIQNAFCLCSSYSSHFRNSALKFLPHTFEIIAAMNIIPSAIITADRENEEEKKIKKQKTKAQHSPTELVRLNPNQLHVLLGCQKSQQRTVLVLGGFFQYCKFLWCLGTFYSQFSSTVKEKMT